MRYVIINSKNKTVGVIKLEKCNPYALRLNFISRNNKELALKMFEAISSICGMNGLQIKDNNHFRLHWNPGRWMPNSMKRCNIDRNNLKFTK